MHEEHFEAKLPTNAREKEIAKVLVYINEGKSCQLIGMPGVSRSTVLGLLTNNKKVRELHLGEKRHTIHFVKVDFSEIRNRSLFDVMKYLFLNLTESLRERGWKEDNINVGNKFREHLQFQDELVLFQGFKEAIDYMALEKHIIVVFLFDRFEEYIPAVTNDFFANLRILRNRAKYQFSIVFSVQRPLEDSLEPTLLADYYEFIAGNSVYVSLADEAITTFRLAYVETLTKKKMAKSVLQNILLLTAGHGKLTKLAIESVLSQEKKIDDIETFLLQQKTITQTLSEIWLSFSVEEQTDLLEGTMQDASTEYLSQVGIINDDEITIPLFTKYIHGATIRNENRGFSYDANSNTIQRGLQVLSDQLTSAEFRLLRYLLQHPDEIVERDTLINIVWEEVKSTAGITDQAVDQLIFRVRRKIEEDPNHPMHLLTVKGRGFKFVP